MFDSSLAQRSTMPALGAVVYAPAFFRDDVALLGALRRGERGARAVLFLRHVAEVELLVLHLLGREAAVSKVVQRAFIDAFGRLKTRRDEPERLRSWLLRVAVRHAQRERFWWRLGEGVRRVGGWLLAPWAGESSGDTEVGSDEGVVPLRATYRLLGRLPGSVATPLCLHWIAGLPVETVAELCSVPVGVARRRLVLARKRFLNLAWAEPELRAWVGNLVAGRLG